GSRSDLYLMLLGTGPRPEQIKDAGPSRREAYAASQRASGRRRGWGPAVRGAPPYVERRRGPRTLRCDGPRPGPHGQTRSRGIRWSQLFVKTDVSPSKASSRAWIRNSSRVAVMTVRVRASTRQSPSPIRTVEPTSARADSGSSG